MLGGRKKEEGGRKKEEGRREKQLFLYPWLRCPEYREWGIGNLYGPSTSLRNRVVEGQEPRSRRIENWKLEIGND
ncbi:hypothetical protein Osc7112_0461 [Oscillatoria nigro-viridis PCC 7112]|uniref:Uncharacterized protein n=1 Tax=Phormidium nigroviride PCC 7112 TaxID=179408 RepID=K9VAG8_9CYAN|nr:hypothetical protein Osc7112_0461 [Oscillatoria nigro-viridis PCC 7112]